MNKGELVAAMATRSDISQAEAGRALDAFLAVVSEEVAAGRDVNVTGYLKFSQVERQARTARNPRTGETVAVPASKAMKVQVGSKLKAAVKG